MATANQNLSAANKAPLFQRYGGIIKDSPQSVTPQNFKSSQIQTTKAESILLDTAKTSTKSQQGPLGANRQTMTLQNSQIHGRKVDSPKIYVNESDIQDSRPKTSAQCNRKIKNKRKIAQIVTPANQEKKIKTFKKEKTGSAAHQTNQTNSGSCLTIFPAHPVSSRRPQQRFDFTFNQDKEDLEAGALPITERDVVKRKPNSNYEFQQKETFNNSTAQLTNNTTAGISKYQQSRLMSAASRGKSNGIRNKNQRERHLSQSMQLGVSLVKPPNNQSLQTPNQSSTHPNGTFSQNQSAAGVKTLKSTRQPKQTTTSQPKCEETSRGRQTRSSDQKSRPTLAAASKKGMTIKKQKTQKSQMSNFNQNHISKSGSGQAASSLRFRYKQKSHSIESQSKFHQPLLGIEARGQQFSFDLDNKENYPSNSSLHHNKSKPLSEQSKSVSAGRSRANGRGAKLQNDLSLSSLSHSSRNLKVDAQGGSLTKMLGKQYFLDGEQMLKLLSPGGAPTRLDNPLRRNQLDAKIVSCSRASSPQKQQSSNYIQQRSSRHKQKSEDGVKCSLDSKSGELKQIKYKATLMTSLGDLASTSKGQQQSTQQKKLKTSTEKQSKQKRAAQELLRKFMEETQRKTDREAQRVKDGELQRMQEIINAKARQKKKRSKSCISKIGDGVFSARDQTIERSKESANRTCLLSEAFSGSFKRVGAKEQSCLVELNNLKREINEEIRRERNIGTEIPRTVMTPSAVKPQTNNNQSNNKAARFDPRKQSTSGTSGVQNYTSLRLPEPTKLIIAGQLQISNDFQQIKNDKRGSEINHNKIRKYIERQKRQAQARKSMRETIEHEKHIKVKETLFELQKFSRGKKRVSKVTNPLRQTNYSINIKNVQTAPGMNSTQQIHLLDHVRNHLPVKNLRGHTKGTKKNSIQQNQNLVQDFSANGSSAKDFEESQFEHTQQQEHLSNLNEESGITAIINIFRKELSSSKSNSNRHASKQSPGGPDDIEYPLKELIQKHPLQTGEHTAPRNKPTNNQRANPVILTDPLHNNQKQSFGQSEFESLEPSRYPTEDKNTSKYHNTRSTPKPLLNGIYDKSDTTANRKSKQNIDREQKRHTAAVTLQRVVRGYLTRKHLQQNQIKKSSPAVYTDHNNTAQSIRKTMNIPSLNLQKINSVDSNCDHPYGPLRPSKHLNPSQQELSSSARSSSIFDHNAFQHSNKPLLPQDDIACGPEMIKIRQEAIKIQEEQEKKKLQLQLNQNKVSPRTFQRKQLELEVWVTKQNNKIKKDQENFEGNRHRNRQDQYLKNVHQDAEQLNKILGSARSSQKSKQLPKLYAADDLLASSAREGINSFRVDSQRKSHRVGVEENRLIDLIYEKQRNTEKQLNESSSQSKGLYPKENQKSRQNTQPDHAAQSVSMRSQSQANSNNYGSQQSQQTNSYRSQYDDGYADIVADENEIPDFQNVHIFPGGTNKSSNNVSSTLPRQNSNEFGIEQEHGSLNRVTSQKKLKGSESDIVQQNQDQKKSTSPRLLSKTDARAKLHDNVDDEEAELARQVMEVSPAVSEGSRSNIKDDLKESLRSENFFLNKMDSTTTNTQADQLPFQQKPSSNIRIEIGDEGQPNSQTQTSALIGTISPCSGASSDFGIQRGGMSLESSTSGENREKLSMIISEIQQEGEHLPQKNQIIIQTLQQTTLTKEQAAIAEAWTDEVLQLLVAELRLDFELLVNRDAAQMIKIQQQQQDQMGIQQLQGIKTDLFAIEKYVDEIVSEIKLNSNEFLQILNTPLTKNNIALLHQLQNTEIGSCEHFDENYPQVLPLDLYLTLEKRRKEERERQNQILSNGERSATGSQTEMLKILIAECEHIHNKVLFDCINDSLLQFKPYGKEGEPLPWSRKNRRLKPTDDFSVNEIFEIVKHDLFRWAITQAGTLPRREFVYRGVFDEELFSEIREKKLVALLAREMIETEPRWLNYEFEQAQVKIDVGDMILEMLVTETIAIMKSNDEELPTLAYHSLLCVQPTEQEEDNLSRVQRAREPYEEHILNNLGIGGSGAARRQIESSQDRSGYNSKDSDFSNNEEGSQFAEDQGGNQSHDESNSANDHDDDF